MSDDTLIDLSGTAAKAPVDDEFDICTDTKHYGAVLYIEGDYAVMRCSFCQIIFRNLVKAGTAGEQKRRSSRTCISACDWITEGSIIKCTACSYTGPLPEIPKKPV